MESQEGEDNYGKGRRGALEGGHAQVLKTVVLVKEFEFGIESIKYEEGKFRKRLDWKKVKWAVSEII